MGEAFIKLARPGMAYRDAMYRAGILQRVGELYEATGMPDKALEHYETFVELWKIADPELQWRVRDVRARVERLRAAIAKKG